RARGDSRGARSTPRSGRRLPAAQDSRAGSRAPLADPPRAPGASPRRQLDAHHDRARNDQGDAAPSAGGSSTRRGHRVKTPPRLAYVAWIAICVIWGTTYLAIRIGLDALPPALMGGVRWTVASVLLSLVVIAKGERLPGPDSWRDLAVQGVLMLGFG